jgi:toxin YhaV
MSPPLVRHGWEIALQPQLFAQQYEELKAEVKRLKPELDPQAFVQHPQVKLLAAVMEGIKERIAADPYAIRIALSGPLRRYGRLKGLGLPDRYRLCFRPFEAEGHRLLLILWLGFPARMGTATTAVPSTQGWCSAATSRKTVRAWGGSVTPTDLGTETTPPHHGGRGGRAAHHRALPGG